MLEQILDTWMELAGALPGLLLRESCYRPTGASILQDWAPQMPEVLSHANPLLSHKLKAERLRLPCSCWMAGVLPGAWIGWNRGAVDWKGRASNSRPHGYRRSSGSRKSLAEGSGACGTPLQTIVSLRKPSVPDSGQY